MAVATANTDYNLNIDTIYDFGDVSIYGQSKLLNITVTNNSSAPYSVAGITISGINSSLSNIIDEPTYPKLFNPIKNYSSPSMPKSKNWL